MPNPKALPCDSQVIRDRRDPVRFAGECESTRFLRRCPYRPIECHRGTNRFDVDMAGLDRVVERHLRFDLRGDRGFRQQMLRTVGADGDFLADLNPDSLKVSEAKIEPSVRRAAPMTRFQFERVGYFCVDHDSSPERLVFNRTATLKDTRAKIKEAS